eukprot:TRINITY_DN437_c0_g1_i1.p1 TRINITY_DN437_c0_g1~~TRINITY_DN437_c0_g1_i1.p1  ORF type:complete len:671 (+),score=222.18 TRINITY_DN437_c0_g1_i1:1568-3580(+)
MPTIAGSIVARFDYDAAADDEVTIRVGEIGQTLNKVSDDWWLVQFGSRSGLIPSNYVSEVLAEAVAEFDYTAQDETEVNFNENDTILVLEKLDADWWIGQVKDMQGMFPSAYVKEVPLMQPGMKQSAPSTGKGQAAASQPKMQMSAAPPQAAPAMMQAPTMPAMPMAAAPMKQSANSTPAASPAEQPSPAASNPDVISYAGMGAIPLLPTGGVVLKKTNKNKDKEPVSPAAEQPMMMKQSEPAMPRQVEPVMRMEPKMPAVVVEPMMNGRVSVANTLENMKAARMEMMSREVAMVAELENQLAESKETLQQKDDEIAALKVKMEKMEKEWSSKLEQSEMQKRDMERRYAALELDFAKVQKELNMISAEESNKVSQLKAEVQVQFDKAKELQEFLHQKDEELIKMQAEQDKMAKSMTSRVQELEKHLNEKDAMIEKMKSEQSSAGKSLADGIWASGELCLNINGATVVFNVTQMGAASAMMPAQMPMMAIPMAAPEIQVAAPVTKPKPMPAPKRDEEEETKEMMMAPAEPMVAPPEPVMTPPTPMPVVAEKKPAPAAAEKKPAPTVGKRGPMDAPSSKAKVASKPAPAMPMKMESAPVVEQVSSGPAVKPRKASYADKLKAGDAPAPAPAAGGKACEQCTPEQCAGFVPNQFKPHLCGTCRHNKTAHTGQH